MIDLAAEARADLRADIAQLKAVPTCDRCGESNFIDGYVRRFGGLYCLLCRMEMNYEARQEEADDRKERETDL